MVGIKRQFNPDQKDELEDPNLKKQKIEAKTQGELFDVENTDDELNFDEKKKPILKSEPKPPILAVK